jgi:DNA ligase-1
MEAFARLYEALDRTTSTNAKVTALVAYLRQAPPADAAWALFFLTGRRLPRSVPTRLLHEWTVSCTALPEWLVEESYSSVGDFGEAVALLLEGAADRSGIWLQSASGSGATQGSLFGDEALPPPKPGERLGLRTWIEERLLPLRGLSEAERRQQVISWWSLLRGTELFLLNKLLTGEFRVGVARTLVVRAVAALAVLPAPVVEHRLMGEWEPSAAAFEALMAPESAADRPSHPYPFYLASPLQAPVETLGTPDEWLVEWKWDGIRAQLIHRERQVFLWSRGEDLLTARFPEIVEEARRLDSGTVLDGEIVACGDEGPEPFATLQRRIGRERQVDDVARAVPVAFVAYDLLEEAGEDIRHLPLRDRRLRLEALLARLAPGTIVRLSEQLEGGTWERLAARREESRARHVEGLMLKRWTSGYGVGRRRGDWWKWKIDPFTIDAVLLYAQPGSGRRATLFTDYTFAVWDRGTLVPVAKAYSGLTDAEIDELDRWIRRHTIERFGPVNAVEPVQVFELGFERIAPSTRHRSGVAVRFPRMLRWRRDKVAAEADTLDTLRQYQETRGGGARTSAPDDGAGAGVDAAPGFELHGEPFSRRTRPAAPEDDA